MKASRAGGRRGLVLLAAASLMATAACGSTAQQAGGQATLGDAGLAVDGTVPLGSDGLGTAGPGPAAVGSGPGTEVGTSAFGTASDPTLSGGPGAPTTGGAPGRGSGSGSGSASGPAGSGVVQPGPGAAGAAGKQGPGVTAKEIFIGFTYTKDGDQANAAVGAAISRGDERQNARAAIDQINERGGVAGRKLVPVFHGYDGQTAEPNESQDQAACTTFTQDKRVFAVVDVGLTENLTACLARAGVLQLAPGSIIFYDDAYMRKYPSFFHQRLNQDRMMRALVPALQRQGYFSGWNANLAQPAQGKAKIGILSLDEASFNRPLDKVMLPTLARAGQPVDPSLVYRISRAATTAQAGETAADVQNATLRFRDAGVTHVILLDSSAFMTLTFLNAARNQRYFPRLGVNSASGLQALYDAGVVDETAYNGAVGLGWLPGLDLPAGQSDRYLTGAAKECLDNIQKRTGQRFTSTNAATLALSACDAVSFVAGAISKAGPTINFTTGLAGAEALGGSLRTAVVPRVFFSPQRHDGLEFGFDLFWDSACKCAKYRDKGHRIPS